jgi:hypothetical protein
MVRNTACAWLVIAGAALFAVAALDWAGYTRFIVSLVFL